MDLENCSTITYTLRETLIDTFMNTWKHNNNNNEFSCNSEWMIFKSKKKDFFLFSNLDEQTDNCSAPHENIPKLDQIQKITENIFFYFHFCKESKAVFELVPRPRLTNENTIKTTNTNTIKTCLTKNVDSLLFLIF